MKKPVVVKGISVGKEGENRGNKKRKCADASRKKPGNQPGDL